MAPVHHSTPRSPRQAARRRAALDRLLDPDLFKALADPTRARILACLVKCGRACSVTEVAECCAVDFSVVNRHLGALARAGLATREKASGVVWYEARGAVLADRFRGLADAIAEWDPGACADEDCPCHERRPG
jgi:DNA-binding transcriptional ArsR family regulator